jgi:predicted peptidase
MPHTAIKQQKIRKMKSIFRIAIMAIFVSLVLPLNAQDVNSEQIKKNESTLELQYLLQLPANYAADTPGGYPLILFLHGSGERGDSLPLVKAWGPPRIASEKGLPFIVISPQCPANEWWTSLLYPLSQLLDQAIETYNIDTNRIYLTGLSMGGFGTFALAQMYPHYFAAIAPICGGGTPGLADFSMKLPTWIFHGEVDEVVPVENSELMFKALQEAGADVKLTVFPGVNHDSWIPAYNNSGLFEWFLEHRKQ